MMQLLGAHPPHTHAAPAAAAASQTLAPHRGGAPLPCCFRAVSPCPWFACSSQGCWPRLGAQRVTLLAGMALRRAAPRLTRRALQLVVPAESPVVVWGGGQASTPACRALAAGARAGSALLHATAALPGKTLLGDRGVRPTRRGDTYRRPRPPPRPRRFPHERCGAARGSHV